MHLPIHHGTGHLPWKVLGDICYTGRPFGSAGRLKRILRTIWISLRTQGCFRTLAEFPKVLIPRFIGIWELDAPYSGPAISSQDADVSILTGDEALAELALARRTRADLPIHFHYDQVESAVACSVAKVNNRIAAVAWAFDNEHPGTFVNVNADEASIRHLYVLPSFRNRGLARKVVVALCCWCFDHGFDRIFAAIRLRNVASERTFVAAGFKRTSVKLRPTLAGPRYDTRTRKWQSWANLLSLDSRWH